MARSMGRYGERSRGSIVLPSAGWQTQNENTSYARVYSHRHRTRKNKILPAQIGARGGLVVKALRYKPAGRGFDSR